VTAASGQQALATAERLLNPADILTAVPADDGASLARGLAGTALLHARLSRTDATFEAAAIRHWAAAAAHARKHGGSGAGIFHTRGGLAASLIIGSGYLPDPGSQRAAAAHAARWLSARTLDLAHCHSERLRADGPCTSWAAYDTISGLAGIGRVLLAALVSGHEMCEPGLTATLDTLTAMILTRHGNRPGWWIPASGHPPRVTAHPSGAANTGMAHGIAGPLALLSIAETAGWTVAGQPAAIGSAAQWLLDWRTNSASWWPPYVTGDDLDTGVASPVAGRRDAWCYGTPGIGRALTLAAHAIGDPQLAETADAAIASLADRSDQDWDVTGPTLCHGHAGVLQSTAHSQAATADRAALAITTAFWPQHAFAFQHTGNGRPADEPGLLTGAAGIALALADHGELLAGPVAARWDAVLLLS
jgi:lantibiotic biosynthesis protein